MIHRHRTDQLRNKYQVYRFMSQLPIPSRIIHDSITVSPIINYLLVYCLQIILITKFMSL